MAVKQSKSVTKKNSMPEKSKFVSPKLAKVYPSKIPGEKKLVLAVSGINIYEHVVFSHEKLSVIRQFCVQNGYSLDESLLEKPVKPKYVPDENEDYIY